MKPIGQTFFINEIPAPTGVAGVFITRIDVYFKTVSPVYGIELQIRTTDNGYPTSNILPFGRKALTTASLVDNVKALVASDDASKPTKFIFDTPVFVETGKPYAFVLVPDGGNPDFNVWTAQIGQTDVLAKTPITINNDSGDLFLSSNDKSWTPIINEDIKYQIYIANFTSTSANAVFKTGNDEILAVRDLTGDFIVKENVYYGNGYFNIAVLNVSSVQGTFSTGHTVYQNTGSANVTGIVYSANSSVIKLSNTTGVFSVTTGGTPLIYNANATANASVTTVSQNVVTTATSNVISVPDSTIFNTNQSIFIGKNNGSETRIFTIKSKPSSTSIQVDRVVPFSETNALYGRLIGDGALRGRFEAIGRDRTYAYLLIDNSTANSVMNLTNKKGVPVIGNDSGSMANVIYTVDTLYNSITTDFASIAAPGTTLDWAFRGFVNDTNYPQDATYIQINDGVPNEFTDKERLYLSRSSEYSRIPVNRYGNNSIAVNINMNSSNNKISPIIDRMVNDVVLTRNVVAQDRFLSGYYITIEDKKATWPILPRLSISSYGNTSSADGIWANSTYLQVANVNGLFVGNVAFTSNTGQTGFINSVERYNESLNNGVEYISRYISKNVILANGQDSEDIRAYLSAYRPANTNFNVYAKIRNTTDNDLFDNKAWTKLTELTPASLQSSKVNIDDFVELIYGFNTSQNIFLSNTTINSSATNTTVICQSTQGLTNNNIVYFQVANNSGTYFNVREIVYVTNATSFVIDRPTSFDSTNASLGVIPGIESTTSAFLYDQNNNIVRYCTIDDAVYDSYIQFAMKIIPVADTTALVPRADDIRVLALQV